MVMHGVTGELYSHELLAVMGPSGAGKSTFVDMISGRKTTGELFGTICLDGAHATPLDRMADVLRAVCAYVPQEVAFQPLQTAYEAVAFAADIRLGPDRRNASSRAQRIIGVLREVGLGEHEQIHRPIGGQLPGGVTIRGLSGGERKRLALACALATRPRLLFLDEITSGLDSENSLAVMRLVKRLCVRLDFAAVCVIHQPRPFVFQLFDRLVLLANGECIFAARCEKLPAHYANVLLQPFPPAHELADDLLQRAVAYPLSMSFEVMLSNHTTPAGVPPSAHPAEPCVTVQTLAERLFSCCRWAARTAAPSQPSQPSEDNTASNVSTHWQLRAVFSRSLLCHYVRSPINLSARLAVYSLLSLADGLIFFQVASETVDPQAVVGAFTFVMLTSYLLPFAMIPIFVYDKQFYVRESGLGLYPTWVYAVSQAVLEAWVLSLTATASTAVIYPLLGLGVTDAAGWQSFFTFFVITALSSCVGSSIVSFFAVLLDSQDLAFAVGSGVATLALALSGGFVSFPQIPTGARWVQWVSPAKYTLQAFSIAQLGGSHLELALTEAQLDRPQSIGANLAVLAGFYALFTLATAIVLAKKRETR